MLDLERMKAVAVQMMSGRRVILDDKNIPVTRTSSLRLRTVDFPMNGLEYQAIEQNADKPSRWGQLTREGKQVVQFRESRTGKYVAVSVDGEVKPYNR
jgi:hypothetical protein